MARTIALQQQQQHTATNTATLRQRQHEHLNSNIVVTTTTTTTKKLTVLSVISLCLPYTEDPHWFSDTGFSTEDGGRCLQEYAV